MEYIWFKDRMEKDFVPEGYQESWEEVMEPVKNEINGRFVEKGYGTVIQSSEEIDKVFTAVFPSEKVVDRIIDKKERNRGAVLFTHHPATWDITAEKPFRAMGKEKIREMREENLSLFTLHGPLDRYGQYSTSAALATALGLNPEGGFGKENGVLNGAVCSTEIEKVEELKERLEQILGHRADIKKYGDDHLGKVGILPGGGIKKKFLEEMVEKRTYTAVSGITVRNSHSEKAHRYAEEQGINILGGTHYTTEKFAMQKLCGYLDSLMVESEFIEGEPCMADIE